MKIVFVGSGVIGRKLTTSNFKFGVIKIFSIRELSDNAYDWKNVIESCNEANVIVYLAYHHFNMIKNIKLLKTILQTLDENKWEGRLIYFNTQSALAHKILKSPFPIKKIFCYDMYTYTKIFQSNQLMKYSDKINISQIYLPVVLGENTKAQSRFEFIAKHLKIYMPNFGNNTFAFLNIEVFEKWFWNLLHLDGKDQKSILNNNKNFIYQDLKTFSGFIQEINNEIADEPHANHQSKYTIIDCKYKYRFTNNFLGNMIWSLKLCPIFLIFNLIRYYVKKKTSNFGFEKFKKSQLINQNFNKEEFYPIGPEYQYYNSTIELNAVEFLVLKIN